MTPAVDFDESIRLLEALYHEPIVPAAVAPLERASVLLSALGNPHRAFRSVHVAGTTGKGSTTTMIGSILQASGARTGYFRSPHLQTYRERIRIDDHDISRDEWLASFQSVWAVVERMRANALPQYGLGRPSLFEILFAMMAVHFRSHNVEWAAVETGLGGRLDPTNTLASDVAVVTNVSLEHTQVLGRTVEDIATEKAAIIKPGCHAVTASEDARALAVITRRARDVGSPLFRVGSDVRVRSLHATLRAQRLALESDQRLLEVTLPLGGAYQGVNACTAFAAALALRLRDVRLGDETIASGLQQVAVPGRFEVVGDRPLVLLDGAHNPAGAAVLSRTLRDLAPGRRITLLFAAMRDKDVGAMAAELAPLVHTAVLTVAPGTERAADVEFLASQFGSVPEVRVQADAGRALDLALDGTSPDGMLVIAGSMYLVGYARTRLASTMAAT